VPADIVLPRPQLIRLRARTALLTRFSAAQNRAALFLPLSDKLLCMIDWSARIDELAFQLATQYRMEDRAALEILLSALIPCRRTAPAPLRVSFAGISRAAVINSSHMASKRWGVVP